MTLNVGLIFAWLQGVDGWVGAGNAVVIANGQPNSINVGYGYVAPGELVHSSGIVCGTESLGGDQAGVTAG
jgi:hypothetical protein